MKQTQQARKLMMIYHIFLAMMFSGSTRGWGICLLIWLPPWCIWPTFWSPPREFAAAFQKNAMPGGAWAPLELTGAFINHFNSLWEDVLAVLPTDFGKIYQVIPKLLEIVSLETKTFIVSVAIILIPLKYWGENKSLASKSWKEAA